MAGGIRRRAPKDVPVVLKERSVESQVQSSKLVTDRRQRIIAAAIKVFHDQGYHSSTTADIAREAGLSQSNLYNYVQSKQDVLFLVCEHLVGTYDAALDRVKDSQSDPYERISASILVIITAMAEFKEEVQLLYNETHSLEKPDRIVILGMISQFIGRFELMIQDYWTAGGNEMHCDARIAANLMSFVPAIVSLRNWDLAHCKAKDMQQAVLTFILNGLNIVPLTV